MNLVYVVVTSVPGSFEALSPRTSRTVKMARINFCHSKSEIMTMYTVNVKGTNFRIFQGLSLLGHTSESR